MSVVDPTLGDPVQPASGVLVLSATRIRDFETCRRRFLMAHVLRVPSEEADSDASVQGRAAHRELFERHAQPEAHDRDGLVADDIADDPIVRQAIRAHSDLCPTRTEPGAVYLGGEVDLRWLMRSKNVLLTGRIDALWNLPSGTLEFRDYKTGRSPDTLADDTPALVYLALAATHSSRPNSIRVSYERLSSNGSVVSLDGSEALISLAFERIRMVADAIRKERDFSATPSDHACRGCRFETLCPASNSRNLSTLTSKEP